MSAERAPKLGRALVTAGCGYEQVSLWTDLPSLSHIGRRHPVVAGVGVGVLVWHLLNEGKW